MKILNAILAILLIAAVGMIFKLKNEKCPDCPSETPCPTTEKSTISEPELLLVLHLDEPVGTLQRFYELFPGSTIDEIDIGMNNPDSALAKQIAKELNLPLTSGKNPFPRKQLDRIIKDNQNGNFLHFSNLNIGSSKLGIGSKATTPDSACAFPPINPATGKPIIAQVIPWVKLPNSSMPFFNKATKDLGFSACGTFINKANEGYLIDPQGFLTLLQGNQAKRK